MAERHNGALRDQPLDVRPYQGRRELGCHVAGRWQRTKAFHCHTHAHLPTPFKGAARLRRLRRLRAARERRRGQRAPRRSGGGRGCMSVGSVQCFVIWLPAAPHSRRLPAHAVGTTQRLCMAWSRSARARSARIRLRVGRAAVQTVAAGNGGPIPPVVAAPLSACPSGRRCAAHDATVTRQYKKTNRGPARSARVCCRCRRGPSRRLSVLAAQPLLRPAAGTQTPLSVCALAARSKPVQSCARDGARQADQPSRAVGPLPAWLPHTAAASNTRVRPQMAPLRKLLFLGLAAAQVATVSAAMTLTGGGA